MKKLTRNETAEFLKTHDRYAILTHRRPDGDTVGSSAALCRILRKMGKTAHVIRNREVTDRFAWLHEGISKEEADAGDCLVSVDVASPGMLPKQFEKYLGNIALRIDHHASATSFTDAELVDSELPLPELMQKIGTVSTTGTMDYWSWDGRHLGMWHEPAQQVKPGVQVGKAAQM